MVLATQTQFSYKSYDVQAVFKLEWTEYELPGKNTWISVGGLRAPSVAQNVAQKEQDSERIERENFS